MMANVTTLPASAKKSRPMWYTGFGNRTIVGPRVSVVSRKTTTETDEDRQHADHVGEARHERDVGRDELGQRFVEVERDDPREQNVEEHQGRAPEPFARERVGQPEDQPAQDEVENDRWHEFPSPWVRPSVGRYVMKWLT